MPFIPIFLFVGGLIARHYVTMKERNENNKIDFLDTEGDIKSSEALTEKYTEPQKAKLLKGSVKIGKFRLGIIPLLIVVYLLIRKYK
jgi:hypothetical protein